MRIGNGYDVHRLSLGRDLILGGVKVDYEYGLLGHSDADVLTHAVADALLGAAALGDIGRHFPDTDETLRGISSLKILSRVREMLESAGYRIVNVDAVIVAQRPRLADYLDKMAENISGTLRIGKMDVNVKATTEEGLGFTGDGSGMAAYAVCLIDGSAPKIGRECYPRRYK